MTRKSERVLVVEGWVAERGCCCCCCCCGWGPLRGCLGYASAPCQRVAAVTPDDCLKQGFVNGLYERVV